MKIVLATIGKTAEAVRPTLRHEAPLDRVVLVRYGEHKRLKLGTERTRKMFKNAGIQVRVVELEDGYDFAGVLKQVIEAVDQEERTLPPPREDHEIVFDVTGGTKVMALAAFTAAWKLGKRVVYNDETADEADEHVQLPVEGLRENGPLSETAMRILQYVQEVHRPVSLADAVSAVAAKKEAARARSVVAYHLDRLAQRGIMERVDDPRDRRLVRYQLTAAGEVALLVHWHAEVAL